MERVHAGDDDLPPRSASGRIRRGYAAGRARRESSNARHAGHEDGRNAQDEARNVRRSEMRRELYLASLVLLLTSGTMAYGQQDKMPGMQMQPPGQAASQAEDLPIPDLLAEAKTAPAMKLDYLENMALQTNPTLRQAQAVARTSTGLAHQAGLWPNPAVGYLGEQIRGGSYHGGEQGGFIQQNILR